MLRGRRHLQDGPIDTTPGTLLQGVLLSVKTAVVGVATGINFLSTGSSFHPHWINDPFSSFSDGSQNNFCVKLQFCKCWWLIQLKTKPNPNETQTNRPNKIGSCSSWATSLTFLLSWLIFSSIQQMLRDPVSEFRVSDMRWMFPVFRGSWSVAWMDKQFSTMLNDRTVTEKGAWPACFSTGNGAVTWDFPCRRSHVIHYCSLLIWGSSYSHPLRHPTSNGNWAPKWLCLISNSYHSCALELN